MAQLWDEGYLSQLLDDADGALTSAVNSIFDRFSLSVTQGQSTYTLPSYVKNIIRVTWKGRKLWPMTFLEFCQVNPTSAVVSETYKTESPEGTPLYYVKHPTDFYSIRFYPTPPETISAHTTEDIWGADINDFVIFSVYRTQAYTSGKDYLHFPSYLVRRIKKAYVLSRAFAKEGKGQNLIASQYYTNKLDQHLKIFKEINSKSYIAKMHVLNDAFGPFEMNRPARPVLPPDYGESSEF